MKEDAKQLHHDLVANMKHWQKIENAAIVSTGQIIERTENPLIRLVAETIQRDSLMHHRVQQFIVDSIEHKAVSLTPDELIEVWDLIEHHIKIEQQTIEMAEQSIGLLGHEQGMIVQDYLLKYLLEDETKHNNLLNRLDDIKKGIYRSV